MAVYFKFSVGSAGASGANARYITRSPATEGNDRAVFVQNYPDYATEGEQYKERQENIVEYARQKEQDELGKSRKGTGQAQTHYRAVASFEGKIDTEKARQMGEEYLKNKFPNARAVGVVHQDTNHTHIHYHIQARDINDKKLRFSRDEWKNLDREWAKIYAREFGRDQAREHEDKKRETAEWKKARSRGEEREKPERINNKNKEIYKDREGRNSGREFIETRTGRDQRALTNGNNRAPEREANAIGRQPEPTPGERAINEFSDRGQQADQQFDRTQSAGRGALQSAQELRGQTTRMDKGKQQPDRDRR